MTKLLAQTSLGEKDALVGAIFEDETAKQEKRCCPRNRIEDVVGMVKVHRAMF